MREPKPIRGAKALLFERLVDEDHHTPSEARPFRIYGVEALRESVGTELMRRILDRLGTLYMIDLLCDEAAQPFYTRFGMRPAVGMAVRNYDQQSGA